MLTDGTATSTAVTRNVAIVAVDTPPAIIVPGAGRRPSTPHCLAGGVNAISVTDVDADGGIEQVTLTVNNGTLTLGSAPSVR